MNFDLVQWNKLFDCRKITKGSDMPKSRPIGFDLLWRENARIIFSLDRRHLFEAYQKLIKKRKISWSNGKDMNLGSFMILKLFMIWNCTICSRIWLDLGPTPMNQSYSSINRKIISFRYYAVSNKIHNSNDLIRNLMDPDNGMTSSCIEISKREALKKLIGMVKAVN